VSGGADSFLQRLWYGRAWPGLSLALLPLSWLFMLVAVARRAAYRVGVLGSVRVSRPVVVVGNVTVGGTGKTPFTIWLARQLQSRGVKVGIVLRGYGGTSDRWPRDVTAESDPGEVGDEAVLLAKQTGSIVVAAPDRVAAARRAIELGATVVLCDDGLQHYRLRRDLEVAVVDAQRQLGNARLLPAGPLREPAIRLNEVDLVVLTRRPSDRSARSHRRQVFAVPRLVEARSITTDERRPLQSFAGRRVHAVAGIGNPHAFFQALSALGLDVDGRALADHARLSADDITFPDDAPVLMTEKDAVKCRAIADARHWAVRMDVELDAADAAIVMSLVERVLAPGHE
jgi:tetraacyldisaccharide 4'-kinase